MIVESDLCINASNYYYKSPVVERGNNSFEYGSNRNFFSLDQSGKRNSPCPDSYVFPICRGTGIIRIVLMSIKKSIESIMEFP